MPVRRQGRPHAATRRAGPGRATDRALRRQFGIASGTKGLTALTVMALVENGTLTLGTTARSLLGRDLPLVGDDVTVEHLLAHRSGTGDYLDESAVDDITDYLAVLDGHPTSFPAGERFAYNNGGYVLLALLAERASGEPFHDVVHDLVCAPAGMADTAFLRSDEPPGRAAVGYLGVDGLRTDVLHLPVRGSGDGGLYSTSADFSRLWEALFSGRVVPLDRVESMVQPSGDWPEGARRYGLGLHLDATGDRVWLEGADAGVSFLSWHQPSSATTCTVVSNWSSGARAVAGLLTERLLH